MPTPFRLLLLAALAPCAAATMGCYVQDRDAASPRGAWEDDEQLDARAYGGYGTTTAQPTPRPAPTTTSLGAVETVAPADAEDTDPAAIATFQPVLSQYGSWVTDPVYGTVWVPYETTVGANFSPYLTNGHWAYTNEGYYWASDYSWGWAPFHYGRWVWIEGRGWSWIAGARYAPAWVDWRYGNGYIGWGPAYPNYCWRGGGIAWLTVGTTPYVFAPSHLFFSTHPSQVVVGPSSGPSMVAGTTPYTPPGRTPSAARPFVGPDPKIVGIPDAHVAKAAYVPPANAHPDNVAWQPAAGSKIAPAGVPPGLRSPSPYTGGRSATSAIAPVASSPTLRPGVTGYAGQTTQLPSTGAYSAPIGSRPGTAQPPSTAAATAPKYSTPLNPGGAYAARPYTPPAAYDPRPYPPPAAAYAPAQKPWTPPSYAAQAPGYGPSPTPYSPSPPNMSAAKPYAPPSYGPAPYTPPPAAYAAPRAYSPPPAAYSPAPRAYAPPAAAYASPPAAFRPSYSAPPPSYAAPPSAYHGPSGSVGAAVGGRGRR